jgi:hypothetical protein
VRDKALEPRQLIIELRTWLRIPVRQVDAADQYAIDRCFDVAGLFVGAVAGEASAGQDQLGAPGQDGDTVPGSLALPNRPVATFQQRCLRKGPVLRLELLQAGHIGALGLQPGQKVLQAAIDVVDIEGGDLHRSSSG